MNTDLNQSQISIHAHEGSKDPMIWYYDPACWNLELREDYFDMCKKHRFWRLLYFELMLLYSPCDANKLQQSGPLVELSSHNHRNQILKWTCYMCVKNDFKILSMRSLYNIKILSVLYHPDSALNYFVQNFRTLRTMQN